MFGKFSDLLGTKDPGGIPPRRSRVNLAKRFTLLGPAASQGSMSRVHRALDTETGRTVCLKVQNLEKNAAAVARASKEEARPDEGDIAIRVAHPNVVRTIERGESSQGEHYVVMEFIDGISLRCVRESTEADVGRKIELLIQAAEGLAAVHAAGFIHHDINPHNFLVDKEGRVKLIDFGLAVPNTPAFRRPGNRTGTLAYLAPEVIRRETKDERLDIYGFGVVAYELLTGKLPYDPGPTKSMAAVLNRLNQDPLDPAKANPQLPPAVCAILRKAIARRKDERYASMAELIHDLQALPPESLRAPAPTAAADDKPPGGVYLLRAGPLFMIRKTSEFNRRLEKVRDLSDKVELIHAIPARNPSQAKEYWHNRFRAKHHKEDWFALSEQDIAEFRACAEM